MSLKRKATDEGAEGRYRKYAFEPAKAPAADGARTRRGQRRVSGQRVPRRSRPERRRRRQASTLVASPKVLGSLVYGPQLEPLRSSRKRALAPSPSRGLRGAVRRAS